MSTRISGCRLSSEKSTNLSRLQHHDDFIEYIFTRPNQFIRLNRNFQITFIEAYLKEQTKGKIAYHKLCTVLCSVCSDGLHGVPSPQGSVLLLLPQTVEDSKQRMAEFDHVYCLHRSNKVEYAK
jgi:hypothetical protein